MNDKNSLLASLDKIHTTIMGVERIKRNLSLVEDDVVRYCINLIQDKNAVISRKGKNWYVEINDIIITVNAHSFTIITAHHYKKC